VITLPPFQFQIQTTTDARIDTIKVMITGKITPAPSADLLH